MNVKTYVIIAILTSALCVVADEMVSDITSVQSIQPENKDTAAFIAGQLSPEEQKLLLKIVRNKQIGKTLHKEAIPSKLKKYIANGTCFIVGLIAGTCSEVAIELNYPFVHNHPFKRLFFRFLGDVGISFVGFPLLVLLREYGYHKASASYALGSSLAMWSGVARTYEHRKSYKRAELLDYATGQNLCEDLTGGAACVRIAQLVTDLWQTGA